MAPSGNTRNRRTTPLNPGLIVTPQIRPPVPPPPPPPPGSLILLPPELRLIMYDNYISQHQPERMVVTSWPMKGPKSRTRTRPRSNRDQAILRMVRGPSLYLAAKWITFEMDANFPLGVLQRSPDMFRVEVDISSPYFSDSIWNMVSLLNSPQLTNKMWNIEVAGWTSISFRGLVNMIHDCGTIPYIGIVLLTRNPVWTRCWDRGVQQLLNGFFSHIILYGRGPMAVNNIPVIAQSVWTYLHPDVQAPVGVAARATWIVRKQMREWMNRDFHLSNSSDEALRRS